MNQAGFNHQTEKELPPEIKDLIEQIVGGIDTGREIFGALTRRAAQEMLVMLEDIAFYGLLQLAPKSGDDRVDVHALVKNLGVENLTKPKTAPYSTDYGAASIPQQYGENHTASGGQMRRLRRFGAALGIYDIQGREFDRYDREDHQESNGERRNGWFPKGKNKGKKHITQLFNVDLLQLVKVASALIQVIKGFDYKGDFEDAWDAYKPKGGCSLLAAIWKALRLPGTIFTPKVFEKDVVEFVEQKKSAQQIYAEDSRKAELIAAAIYEFVSDARYDMRHGIKPPPIFWEKIRRFRAELRKIRENLRSMHRSFADSFVAIGVGSILPMVELPF